MMRLLFTLLFCFYLLNSCGQEGSGYGLQEQQEPVQETEDPMQIAEKAAPKSLKKNIQEQEEVEVDMEDLRRPHPEVTREKMRNAPIDSSEKLIRVECDCPQDNAQMQQTTPDESSTTPVPETRQEQEEENNVPKLPGRRPHLPPGYDDSSYKPI